MTKEVICLKMFFLNDQKDVTKKLCDCIMEIYPDFQIVLFDTVRDLKSAVLKTGSAVVFINVIVPDCMGIALANQINQFNPILPIILYSNYSYENFDVYEAKHVYFLESPLRPEKIKKAVNYAIKYLNHLFFSYFIGKKEYYCPLDSICYFESFGRKIRLVGTCSTNLFYHKLDDVEARLSLPFLRVSKYFLINPIFIRQIVGNKIYLKQIDNEDSVSEISITKNYKENVSNFRLFI